MKKLLNKLFGKKLELFEVNEVKKPIILKDTVRGSGVESLKFCPSCNVGVHKDSKFCPNCNSIIK